MMLCVKVGSHDMLLSMRANDQLTNAVIHIFTT